MPKQAEAPIYWRNGRDYLDARAYAEVGGGQERLVPPGEKLATKDPIVARDLAALRVQPDRSDGIPPAMLHTILAHLPPHGGKGDGGDRAGVRDVSFDRETVAFRPNRWRRLKSGNAIRVVPLRPQLEGVLRRHVFGREAPLGSLLDLL